MLHALKMTALMNESVLGADFYFIWM